MVAHAHPWLFAAVYFGIWAVFIGGLVFAGLRASKRERD